MALRVQTEGVAIEQCYEYEYEISKGNEEKQNRLTPGESCVRRTDPGKDRDTFLPLVRFAKWLMGAMTSVRGCHSLTHREE